MCFYIIIFKVLEFANLHADSLNITTGVIKKKLIL